MKINLRHLLFCAALAGMLPLSLAAQADAPPVADKNAPAVAVPAASEDSSASTSTPAATAAESTSSASTTDDTKTATPAVEVESSDSKLRRLDSAPASSEASAAPEQSSANAKADDKPARRRNRGSSDNARVTVGGDATLGKGEEADAVVAIGGDATSDGTVRDSVVAVAGNARATGPVGDSVVAVLGNAYVDGPVRDVVAVLGNIELGPNAVVRGNVVPVGGRFIADPKAVHGSVQNVNIGFGGIHAEWLQSFIKNCALKGRLLAIAPHLAWAWTIAFGFLGLYVVFGLLFGGAVEKCATTLETRPWRSILASLLTLLLTPVLIVLLCITVIGIAVVPFLAIGLVCANLFGRAVMLAWLGRRITRHLGNGPLSHPAFAVLIGGIIVLGLYLVPFVGIFVYKLLGFLGLGVVVYTLLLSNKREKPTPAAVPVASAAVGATPETSFAFAGTGVAAAAPVTAPIPPVALATLPRAGFWIRMGALAVDGVLIGMLCLVSSGILPRFMHLHFPGGFLLALATYGAILWKLKGTTVGGIICGLRVVRTDGREFDWATAVVRALGCFLSLFLGLGFIWIAIDDEKQGWHDKIAGTAVVFSRSQSLV